MLLFIIIPQEFIIYQIILIIESTDSVIKKKESTWISFLELYMPSTKNLPYSLHLLIRFITYSSSWNYTLPFVNYPNFFLPWIGFLYFIQCNSLKKFIILFYSSLLGFFLELGTKKTKNTLEQQEKTRLYYCQLSWRYKVFQDIKG